MMSEVGPRLSSNKPLNNEYYETRDLENSDSGGYIHLDGGTDRIRNDELHGARPDSILKNTELNKRTCRHLTLMPAVFLLVFHRDGTSTVAKLNSVGEST